jgi:hypothetical protein
MQCGRLAAAQREPSLLRGSRPGIRELPKRCKQEPRFLRAKADSRLSLPLPARQGAERFRSLRESRPTKLRASSGDGLLRFCYAPGQRLRKQTLRVRFWKIAFWSYCPWSPVGTEVNLLYFTAGDSDIESKLSISFITNASFRTIGSGWCIVRVDCEEEVPFSR